MRTRTFSPGPEYPRPDRQRGFVSGVDWLNLNGPWDFRAAEVMRERGADVRAVTAWALMGSFEWNSLVTRSTGHYESGAFALQDGTIKSTPLADILRRLARNERALDLLPNGSGWWHRRERLRISPPNRAAA